jgi:hypothetical protein
VMLLATEDGGCCSRMELYPLEQICFGIGEVETSAHKSS